MLFYTSYTDNFLMKSSGVVGGTLEDQTSVSVCFTTADWLKSTCHNQAAWEEVPQLLY